MARLLRVWLAMLALAVGNGALRDLTYGPVVGSLTAHWLSTLSALVLFGIVMAYWVRRTSPANARATWLAGLVWMGLTLAFEFLFFHYVAGHPWDELLANYDVPSGRVWVVIPLWLLCGPTILWRFGLVKR